MQVLIYRYSPGVYGLEWRGMTSRDDLLLAKEELWRMASFSGDTEATLIVDFSRVDYLPFSSKDFRHVIASDPRVVSYVLVKAPIRAQVLADELQRVTRHEIKMMDSLSKAIESAQSMFFSAAV